MKRITHIDDAKAIGIMLIIMSHIGVDKELNESFLFSTFDDIINSFYVPLFFILSGIFEPNTLDWKKYAIRLGKLLKYIIIFYIFGIISAGLVRGDWSLGHVTSKTVIWFLFTLTWITVIMGCIKNVKFNFFIVILLAAAGCLLSYNERSFMYIGQALLCLPFYAFGFYTKNFLKNETFIWWRALCFLSGWLLLFVLFYSEQNLSLNYITQNYFTFYLTAFLGSLFIIEVCKLLHCDWLSYYGQNSIVPMMVQFVFIWEILKFWHISTVWEYLLCSLIICLLCGASIPLFRNPKYDIFK